MKTRNAVALAALASLMALPLVTNAQSRGRGDDNRSERGRQQSQSHRSHGSRSRHEDNKWDRSSQYGQNDHHNSNSWYPEAQRRWEEQQRQERQRLDALRRQGELRQRQDWERSRYQNNSGYYRDDHRSNQQNEWRNIAVASGLLGVLGLLQHDNTLFFTGAAGALYSTYRYDQDRRSTDRSARARAEYFSKSYFTRDGRRYDRQTVNRNGQSYYQFVCRD